MWKWVAIIFVVFTVAGAFQKSSNPFISGAADIAVLVTVYAAYRSWRNYKEDKKIRTITQKGETL